MEARASRAGRAGWAARASVVLLLSCSYFAYVFQLHQGTWRVSGISAWMDPYFINALLEHWYFSLRHFTDPVSPPMFYPATGTLGYSVGLILFAPFYILVRPWVHPFVACTLTLFLVMETGTLSLYAVLRRFLALGFIESMILTAFFCTSANVVNSASNVWSQELSVFLVPSILLLGLWTLGMTPRTAARSRLRSGCAVLTGLLATLLFTQDFYTGLLTSVNVIVLAIGGWFIFGPLPYGPRVRVIRPGPRPAFGPARRMATWVAVLICALGLAWMAVSLWGGVLGIRFDSHHHHGERPGAVALAACVAVVALRGGIRTRLRIMWLGVPRIAWAFAAGASLGLAIFLRIYLGPALEHPSFPEWELMATILPRDLSGWHHPVDLARSLVGYESARSFLAVLAIALSAWIPGLRVSRRIRMGSLWLLLLAVLVALFAIDVNGFALWKTALSWLPGFAAIRDPKRIVFPFELAVALCAGLFLADLKRRPVLRIGLVVLLGALLVGQWNTATFSYARPTAPFDRYVGAPIEIDRSCRSFFVARASDTYVSRWRETPWLIYSIDAMFIASKSGIPTLNGYSAWPPAGWWESALADPDSPDYPAGVKQWAQRHGLRDVCVLDIEAHTMTRAY